LPRCVSAGPQLLPLRCWEFNGPIEVLANLAGNKGPVTAFIPDITKAGRYLTEPEQPSHLRVWEPSSPFGVSKLDAMCQPHLYRIVTPTAHPFPPFPLPSSTGRHEQKPPGDIHAAPAINRSWVLLTKSSGITRCPSCPSCPSMARQRRKPETGPVLAF
jgi:hypothetical protein